MRIFSLCAVALLACVTEASEEKLLFHTSFDSPQSLFKPEVGSAAVFSRPVEMASGICGGAALIRQGAGSLAFLLPNGLPPESGRIEFDAKILNKREWFRDRGDPTFFSIFDAKSSRRMLMAFEINANNGHAKSGWYFRMNHLKWVTSLSNFSSQISYRACFGNDDPKAWHHYEIRWNVSGLDGSTDTVRIKCDEKLILSMKNRPEDMDAYVRRMREPAMLYFAREFDEPGQNHSDYIIDEFKIWDRDKAVPDDVPAVEDSSEGCYIVCTCPHCGEKHIHPLPGAKSVKPEKPVAK